MFLNSPLDNILEMTYQMAYFMSPDYKDSSMSLSVLINWLKISEDSKLLF